MLNEQTLYIILLALCAAVVAALGLFIYLTRKVNAMSHAVDYLLRQSDYQDGEIAGLLARISGNGGYTGCGRGKSAGPDVCEEDGK